MSDSTAAAVIGACAALGAAVLTLIAVLLPLLLSIRRRAGSAEQHAKVAADQTGNDHPENLRDELDHRHEENARAIASVEAAVRSSDRRNGRRWARTNRRIDEIADRLDDVEHTIPRPIRRRT